jgi:hypothetical protein
VDRILEMVSTAPVGLPPSEAGVLVIHGRDKVQKFVGDAVASFNKGLLLAVVTGAPRALPRRAQRGFPAASAPGRCGPW